MHQPSTASAGYRPHLDGIRAIAVVMVILFHLGFTWVPGGFIGVDVFFVLSGYLITGLLVDEATRSGAIRLGRFYARRARRLLPASIAVLLAVMFVAWWLFDPVQKQDLGWDATWAALYSANWRFARAGGDYFAPGDVPSPLVHYWSLAVEEQFYVVWPALVLVLHRLARRIRAHDPLPLLLSMVLGLAAASAVASVRLAGTPLTYYGTHARAYQLLTGGALAIAVRRWHPSFGPTARGRAGASAVAVGSLGALGLLAHRVADASQYPGWPGLMVTAASLTLIAGLDLGPTAPTTRLVGHRSLAAVGRLSYSLYIWHWPVIVLLPVMVERWGNGRTWLTERTGVVAITVLVALASYLLVERPIRFNLRSGATPLRVVGAGLTCSLLTGLVAYPVFQPHNSFDQAALRAVRDLAKPGACPYFAEDWPAAHDAEPCVYRDGAGPVVALVGDSHAQQWQPALEVLARRSDARIIRATRGGCPANDVVAYARSETGRNEADTECSAWRHHVYRSLVDDFHPDVVVVATRSHVRGIRVDGRDVPPTDPRYLGLWTHSWDWTVRTLTSKGARVVVSEIIPTLPERVPACLIRQGEGTTRCDFPAAGDTTVGPYNEVIARLTRLDPLVSVVDPTVIACPGGTCTAVLDGVIVHRDDNHLSATYVRSQADAFAALLAAAGAAVG